MESQITYPDAHDLDAPLSGDTKIGLYLVPAAERDDGRPCVVTTSYVGTSCIPMHAWHGRWLYLGEIPAGAVGESVLDHLRAIEDTLLGYSAQYQGNRWDGHNLVGSWGADESWAEAEALGMVGIDWERAGITTRWDAADWLSPSSADWADLCREAKLDPERGAGVLDAVVDHVDSVASGDGVWLEGTESYVERLLEEWAEAQEDESADA